MTVQTKGTTYKIERKKWVGFAADIAPIGELVANPAKYIIIYYVSIDETSEGD